ncbi:Uncharacterized protein Fot_01009 [Forsythia ovata]|uniref:Uncharacterized protein n=1 Tax=Forsythia ovata TaxID=205694 RepID=A0ABD1X3L7_9LAMI
MFASAKKGKCGNDFHAKFISIAIVLHHIWHSTDYPADQLMILLPVKAGKLQQMASSSLPHCSTAALIEEHSIEGVRKRPSRHTKIYEGEFGEEFIDAIKKKYFSYTLSLSTTARRRINGMSKDLLVMHPYENKAGNIGNNLRLRWKPAVSGLAAIVTGSSPPLNFISNQDLELKRFDEFQKIYPTTMQALASL